MFYLRPTKSKKGINVKVKSPQKHINNEIKEVFVGRKTVFSFIGLTVGSILVGRSFWEYGRMYIGIPLTILAGFVIFIICGLILKQFKG